MPDPGHRKTARSTIKSYAKVIRLLTAKGLKAIAVQHPLSSLADDVKTVKRTLSQPEGPVLLVGHSWGGPVITEAGNDPQVATGLRRCASPRQR